MRAIAARARAALKAFRADPARETEVEPPQVEAAQASTAILDSYVREAPSAQAAVDIFGGEWSSALPDELGVESGHAHLFDDRRIRWLIDQLGGVEGISVLELGPLEGGHTTMLCRAGARVDAIEANNRAFLKCLIAKELLALTGARFLHGDFVEFLKSRSDERWDLVLASGVLYHMQDPFELLTLIAGVTDRIAIWTHYFDEAIVTSSSMARQFDSSPERVTIDGHDYVLHRRRYLEALNWGGFCGGSAEDAIWIEREDLMRFLGQLGFDRIDIGFDEPGHVNGPSILLLAERRRAPNG